MKKIFYIIFSLLIVIQMFFVCAINASKEDILSVSIIGSNKQRPVTQTLDMLNPNVFATNSFSQTVYGSLPATMTISGNDTAYLTATGWSQTWPATELNVINTSTFTATFYADSSPVTKTTGTATFILQGADYTAQQGVVVTQTYPSLCIYPDELQQGQQQLITVYPPFSPSGMSMTSHPTIGSPWWISYPPTGDTFTSTDWYIDGENYSVQYYIPEYAQPGEWLFSMFFNRDDFDYLMNNTMYIYGEDYQGVALYPNSSNYGLPASQVTHTQNIRNLTNFTETYTLSLNSSWPTSINLNGNKNRIFGNNFDTSSRFNNLKTSIEVPPSETLNFLVNVFIPQGTPMESYDTATIYATALSDTSHQDSSLITTTAHVIDVQEPNDFFSDATVISEKGWSWDSDSTTEIYPEGDLDYYTFTAITGQTIGINMNIDTGSTLDGAIAIYDEDYKQLHRVNYNYSGGDEAISFGAPYDGQYYILCAYTYDVPYSKGMREKAKNNRGTTGDYILQFSALYAPVFGVDPVSLTKVVNAGSSDTDNLTISNTGEADLTYSAQIEYQTSKRVELLDEDWSSGDFTTQLWSFDPSQDNWQIDHSIGNSVPSAIFDYYPYAINYEHSLVSRELYGTLSTGMSLQYDIILDASDTSGTEYMTVEVFDGSSWHLIEEYNNTGDIPWSTQGPYDISNYAAGNVFQVRFRIHGSYSWNFWYWAIDNIIVNESGGPDWLTLNGEQFVSGTVPGDFKNTEDITVGYDATDLSNGIYSANIIFHHNTNTSPDIVDVTMNVGGVPEPPDNVVIEVIADGDNVRISWTDEGYVYYVYSSDDPYAVFPGGDWTLETPAGISGDQVVLSTLASQKKFYVVTAGEVKR